LSIKKRNFFIGSFANKNEVFITKQGVLVQIFLKAKLFSLLVPFALQSKGQKQVIIK
jgi:hypothetical protein